MKEEIYISTDIETDGPIPGMYSMLSFGSAAFTKSKGLIGTYTANLECLLGANQDPDTMAWWGKNMEAYNQTRSHLKDPKQAMVDYRAWMNLFDGKLVFVGYPASYDFMFVYWYMIRFVGKCPFSFSALDIKTYAMAMLKTGFKETSKRRMPQRWFSNAPHTHNALDDAVEQGQLFMNMLKENTI